MVVELPIPIWILLGLAFIGVGTVLVGILWVLWIVSRVFKEPSDTNWDVYK